MVETYMRDATLKRSLFIRLAFGHLTGPAAAIRHSAEMLMFGSLAARIYWYGQTAVLDPSALDGIGSPSWCGH